MDALFFITVACFFALFVAALSVARHVRIERTHRKETPENIWGTHAITSERQSRFSGAAIQSVQNLSQVKEPDWRFLVSDERETTEKEISPRLRKSPVSSHSDHLLRLNLAQFNNDPGDLSDPYQPPTTRAARAGGRRSLLILPRKEAS